MKLFIPMEVVYREYESRLFVATEAASRGLKVIFGHKNTVFDQALLQGGEDSIWFGRGSINRELVKRGVKLICHDEESGIIYEDYATYYNYRIGLEEIPMARRFFCWGPDDYKFLKLRHGKNDLFNEKRFAMTGSPRAALWGKVGSDFYKDEILNIRKSYGDYILFVSNLGFSNSILGKGVVSHLKRLGNWQNIKDMTENVMERETRLMNLYVKCAAGLAKKFNINVIVRPHLVENVSKWQLAFRDSKNVHVVAKGSLSPWIHASQCIIHNSCTSGIEAACIDKPAIALGEKHQDLEAFGASYSNSMSLAAIGESQLYNIFSKLDTLWPKYKEERINMLNRKLFNYGGLKSIRGMVSELIQLESDTNKKVIKVSQIEMVSSTLKRIGRYLASAVPSLTPQMRLVRQKRPQINLEKLNADLVKSSNILGLKTHIKAVQLQKNLFLIQSEIN